MTTDARLAHDVSTASSRSGQAIPVLLALLGFCLAVIPRLVPFVVIALGVAALLNPAWRRSDILRAAFFKPAALWLLAIVAYVALNALIGLSPERSLKKIAEIAPLVAATVLLVHILPLLQDAEARKAASWFLAAFGIGVAFLLMELVFSQPVSVLWHNLVPASEETIRKHFVVEDGRIVEVASYHLNRNVANLVLLLWPAALLLYRGDVAKGRARIVALTGLFAAAAACVFLSDSGSAVVALTAGVLTFGVAMWRFRVAHLALAAAFVGAMVLAVPLGGMPLKQGWNEFGWLPKNSVIARFYIWGYTADKTMESPWVGIGADATRLLPQTGTEFRRPTPEEHFQPRPSIHAHNAYLQVWLELGAIGAALVLGFGITILAAIGQLGRVVSPFAIAAFASVCTILFSAFGLWQTWQLGGIMAASMAIALSRSTREASSLPKN